MTDKQIQKLETLLKIKTVEMSIYSISGMLTTQHEPITYQDLKDTATRLIRRNQIPSNRWQDIKNKLQN